MDSAEWTAYDVEKAKRLNQENEIKMTLERREELKDELKNSISMALKDPILQQGFEIICKENAELKKCKYCNGSGFVQVAPNTRGLKLCPFCKGKSNSD